MPTLMFDAPNGADFALVFAPPVLTDALRDELSLLASCPMPCSDSDWEWEAERDEEDAWRVTVEWEAAERARRNDRLSQECPWMRFDEDEEGEF
jgi:hypothetical protein